MPPWAGSREQGAASTAPSAPSQGRRARQGLGSAVGAQGTFRALGPRPARTAGWSGGEPCPSLCQLLVSLSKPGCIVPVDIQDECFC